MSPTLGSAELLQILSTALLSSYILFLLEELWSNRKKEGEQVEKSNVYWWRVFQRYRNWCSIFNRIVVRPKHPVSLQGLG